VVAAELAGRLGVAPTLEGFAAVPVDRLVAAQSELSADIALHPDPGRWREITANLMPFEPVVDGQILPARPVDGVAAWNGRAADLLVGTNRNEHRLFVVPTGVADVANDATLQMAAGTLGLDASGLDAYRADGAGAGDVLAEVLTDWFYRIPAIRLAEAHQGESYMYEFGWNSPASGVRLGACHGLEIGFVFDTLDSRLGWPARTRGCRGLQSRAPSMPSRPLLPGLRRRLGPGGGRPPGAPVPSCPRRTDGELDKLADRFADGSVTVILATDGLIAQMGSAAADETVPEVRRLPGVPM
jgi:hypothetical protein